HRLLLVVGALTGCTLLSPFPACPSTLYSFLFFFFNHPSPSEIYTLSLHDALPISAIEGVGEATDMFRHLLGPQRCSLRFPRERRSEEHTSELQSHLNLVCRLLLEKKK